MALESRGNASGLAPLPIFFSFHLIKYRRAHAGRRSRVLSFFLRQPREEKKRVESWTGSEFEDRTSSLSLSSEGVKTSHRNVERMRRQAKVLAPFISSHAGPISSFHDPVSFHLHPFSILLRFFDGLLRVVRITRRFRVKLSFSSAAWPDSFEFEASRSMPELNSVAKPGEKRFDGWQQQSTIVAVSLFSLLTKISRV